MKRFIWLVGNESCTNREVIDGECMLTLVELVVSAENLAEVVNPEGKWSLGNQSLVHLCDFIDCRTQFMVEGALW